MLLQKPMAPHAGQFHLGTIGTGFFPLAHRLPLKAEIDMSVETRAYLPKILVFPSQFQSFLLDTTVNSKELRGEVVMCSLLLQRHTIVTIFAGRISSRKAYFTRCQPVFLEVDTNCFHAEKTKIRRIEISRSCECGNRAVFTSYATERFTLEGA
jgi:hypothetical protein